MIARQQELVNLVATLIPTIWFGRDSPNKVEHEPLGRWQLSLPGHDRSLFWKNGRLDDIDDSGRKLMVERPDIV